MNPAAITTIPTYDGLAQVINDETPNIYDATLKSDIIFQLFPRPPDNQIKKLEFSLKDLYIGLDDGKLVPFKDNTSLIEKDEFEDKLIFKFELTPQSKASNKGNWSIKIPLKDNYIDKDDQYSFIGFLKRLKQNTK